MKIKFMPNSRLGWWSVGLIISSLLFFGLFLLLIALGQLGGDTFFGNPILAIPGILVGITGITSFFTGIIGIVKNKERSILVCLATVIGFLVLFFVLVEISFTH